MENKPIWIKVIGCSSSKYWYANLRGIALQVYGPSQDGRHYTVAYPKGYSNEISYVLETQDCLVIETEKLMDKKVCSLSKTKDRSCKCFKDVPGFELACSAGKYPIVKDVLNNMGPYPSKQISALSCKMEIAYRRVYQYSPSQIIPASGLQRFSEILTEVFFNEIPID